MENLFEKTNEEIKALVDKMERKELKELCEKSSVKDIFKLIGLLVEDFNFETAKFIDKKNKSAGLRSRKLTGDLETVFMSWRKKSIEATKDASMLA